MAIEQGSQLTRNEVKSVKKHLSSGIVAESLKPVGTIETNDGRRYFSSLLLGCTSDRFKIEFTGSASEEFLMLHRRLSDGSRTFPVAKIFPHGLRSVALYEDDLKVGVLGYLLKPYQDLSDVLRFELEQQPQSKDFLSQSIELKVNLAHLGKRVDLLVLYPTYHQRNIPDRTQFVVISHDFQILPHELVFVPLPDRILSKSQS